MRVKPAVSGAVVRDPLTLQRLPDEGGDVPETGYWLRRLEQGDVVPADEPGAQADAPPAGE
jgi:hypothetical protein